MNFYGQTRIWIEMYGFLNSIVKEGVNDSFMFTAPSGYGKTEMALILASKIEPDYNKISYQVPDKDGNVLIDRRKRVHIIDEAHLITTPELLYPIMDRKEHVFFFLTNEKGILKEPLRNRCKCFRFEDYTVDEVTAMVHEKLESMDIHLKKELEAIIATESNLNPRVALKEIVERLVNLFKMYGVPKKKGQLRKYLREYLGIVDGLNRECQAYIEVVKRARICSIDHICSVIRLEKSYVIRELEPVLIKKDLVEVTPRGRRYKGDDSERTTSRQTRTEF